MPMVSSVESHECWVDRRSLPWRLLDDESLTHIGRAYNRPLWVLDRLSKELASVSYTSNYTSRERLTLLKYVETLTNAVGACERIHQTAVPLNYARHSLRSLTIWLVTLPFAIVKDMGFLTGPVVAVVSWLLLGVYQIGYEIEDPFQGSLRLSILCDAVRNDILGSRHGGVDGSAFELRNNSLDLMGQYHGHHHEHEHHVHHQEVIDELIWNSMNGSSGILMNRSIPSHGEVKL